MVDIINMGGPFSFCMFLFIIPCIRSAACKTVGFTSSRAFALGNKAGKKFLLCKHNEIFCLPYFALLIAFVYIIPSNLKISTIIFIIISKETLHFF